VPEFSVILLVHCKFRVEGSNYKSNVHFIGCRILGKRIKSVLVPIEITVPITNNSGGKHSIELAERISAE
jgi:hypothetical protein